MTSPVAPSAVSGSAGALNADGSTLKAGAPNGVFPLAEATSIPVAAFLTAQPARAAYVVTHFAHRFEVSASPSFDSLLSAGMGVVDSQGLIRYATVPLPTGRKLYWRVRAESDDKYGPWSPVMSFTTTGTATAAPPSTDPNAVVGPRPNDPPAGSRLPLPDARPFINAMSGLLGQLNQCPNGRKYESNPWLDRLIDNLRASDARWGYNGKPTKQPFENGGFPVTAAGDEIAYHYGAGESMNSPDVYLIDAIEGHCGSSPRTTYRDFTGEEPGRWTLTRAP
ncbi:MAG: hypothetical protein Q8N52_10870 [Acidobacteriota bacterium]|nr:hypothetical protein [Acidobacteriota bacterium]